MNEQQIFTLSAVLIGTLAYVVGGAVVYVREVRPAKREANFLIDDVAAAGDCQGRIRGLENVIWLREKQLTKKETYLRTVREDRNVLIDREKAVLLTRDKALSDLANKTSECQYLYARIDELKEALPFWKRGLKDGEASKVKWPLEEGEKL